MSGHSKWSQIKHKKAASDAKRGLAFSKMAREITVAAKTGGISPNSNARLRSALERAKSLGLPKDNIERALAKASGSEEGATLQEFLYEASAPSGVAILIEGITDNKNRTLSEIKRVLQKGGGKLAEQGSLLWNFEKIGTLEILPDKNQGKTGEEIELAVIESGAKDFRRVDDGWLVETDPQALEKVRKNLEDKKIESTGWGLDYKPKSALALPEESLRAVNSLLDSLTDLEDVQEVYTNLAE